VTERTEVFLGEQSCEKCIKIQDAVSASIISVKEAEILSETMNYKAITTGLTALECFYN
jgi:hypothetical protein